MGMISQSHPYEIASSNDDQSSPRLPQRDSSFFGFKANNNQVNENKNGQPVDFYQVVKARQNLLYIQKENFKA